MKTIASRLAVAALLLSAPAIGTAGARLDLHGERTAALAVDALAAGRTNIEGSATSIQSNYRKPEGHGAAVIADYGKPEGTAGGALASYGQPEGTAGGALAGYRDPEGTGTVLADYAAPEGVRDNIALG